MTDGNHAETNDGENANSNLHQPNRATASGPSTGTTSASDAASTSLTASDLAHASVPVRLRAAREALGLSTAEIAARTRITLRHVVALENGDYASLPGRPYAIGFARGYARAVGLDAAVVADAVRGELVSSSPRPEPRGMHQFEVGDPAKTPSRLVGWLALLLVIAILGLGAIFWRSYYLPAVPLPSLADLRDERPAVPARSTGSAGGGVTTPVAMPSGGAVIFTALEQGIWVKFYDGHGKQLMQKQLAKGESYTVPSDADSPKLWTGRPDALAITIGGQGVPRLGEVEKIMKDVPVDATSLRSRGQAPGAAPSAAPTAGILP